MKKKIWVIVASRALTKIYSAENGSLQEIKVLEHPESLLNNRDLTSDGYGRNHNRFGHGTAGMDEKFPPKIREAMSFAKQIIQFIEEAHNKGELDKVHIIAPPAFLGYLREHYGSTIPRILGTEVDKDLLLYGPKEIREYLPPVL